MGPMVRTLADNARQMGAADEDGLICQHFRTFSELAWSCPYLTGHPSNVFMNSLYSRGVLIFDALWGWELL